MRTERKLEEHESTSLNILRQQKAAVCPPLHEEAYEQSMGFVFISPLESLAKRVES